MMATQTDGCNESQCRQDLFNEFIGYGIACIYEFSADFYRDTLKLQLDGQQLADAMSVEFSGPQVNRIIADLELMSDYEGDEND